MKDFFFEEILKLSEERFYTYSGLILKQFKFYNVFVNTFSDKMFFEYNKVLL